MYAQKDAWHSVILQQFYNKQKDTLLKERQRQVDYEF